jgi:hypothetical protein
MRRSLARLGAVGLMAGCIACPASMGPMPTGDLSSKVELTQDTRRVEGCKMIGTVEGWRDAEKKNRAYVLAAGQGAYAGGARPDVVVLRIDGGDDEVFVCEKKAGPAAAPK